MPVKTEKPEQLFAAVFVQKKRQERSLFELNSKKRRGDFFNKLCHRYFEILDQRFMESISTSNFEEILKILKREGAQEECYVLSTYEELDAKAKSLSQALEECEGRGLPGIILCVPDKLAYFEAEQEIGPPPRFLLKRN